MSPTPLPDYLKNVNCFHAAAALALGRLEYPRAQPTSKKWFRQASYEKKERILEIVSQLQRELPLPNGFTMEEHAEAFVRLHPELTIVFVKNKTVKLFNPIYTPVPFANFPPRRPHPYTQFPVEAKHVVIFKINDQCDHIDYVTYLDYQKEVKTSCNAELIYCPFCNRNHTPWPDRNRRACPLLKAWGANENFCPTCCTVHSEMDVVERAHCPKPNCGFVTSTRGCAFYHNLICSNIPKRCAKRANENSQEPSCKICLRNHSSGECTLSTKELYTDVLKRDQIWAWDTEAELKDERVVIGGVETTVQNHRVNCVVAVRVYPPSNSPVKVFFENLGDFIAYMQTITHKSGKCYLWAHNLSGYDGRHLMAHLVERGEAPWKQSVIQNNRFFKIVFGGLVFMDFYKHFSQSLDASIAAYGIEQDSGFENKLFFPYRFNCPENRDYVGPFPGKEWFDSRFMAPGKKEKFERWYETMKDTTFDLREELKQYCLADTLILASALRAHHETMKEITGFTPLYSVTSPSFARAVWQQGFYNEELTAHPEMRLVPLTQEQYDFEKESIHGGRTDVRTFCYELTEEEIASGHRIRYVDVTSMYPHVMRNFPLPCGKVRELTPSQLSNLGNGFLLNETYIAEVDVDPPNAYLHHPVLVTLREGKLVATLEPLRNYVVTSIELSCAIEQGYVVRRVHRVHHYDSTGFLFKKYVDRFMEIKDRAAREGNKAMKQLAKIMLNSLYGKFLQRPNIPSLEFKHAFFQKDIDSWKLDILKRKNRGEIHLASDFICLKETSPFVYQVKVLKTDLESSLKSTQASVGSFIAAGGRIILGRELMKLGKRVLYHDTDSVVYVDDGGPSVMEGEGLGEWTDECSPGEIITHFVSLAPKTYAYRVRKPNGETKEVVKVKGITLHAAAKEEITYDTMKELLMDPDRFVEVDQFSIEYQASNQKLRSRVMSKLLHFSPKELKGEFMEDSDFKRAIPVFVTRPFGWKRYL